MELKGILHLIIKQFHLLLILVVMLLQILILVLVKIKHNQQLLLWLV